MNHSSKPVQIYLSRRNLLTLISKLDRVKQGEASLCTLMKNDNQHPTMPQNHPCVFVTAVEDDDYYVDRDPGDVHPADEPK